MLSRFPICWSLLFMLVMLSSTSESAYSTEQGYGSLLPPSVVALISNFRWVAWGAFILDGIFTSFKLARITRYHMRFLIFYGIMFLASLLLVANIHQAGAVNEITRYVLLLAITAVIPLQLEDMILRRGVDETLKTLFYNVVILTFIGIAATLRATGFTFRYTGWIDNPNSFVLINIFFIVVVMANYVRQTFSKSLLIPLLLFLVYVQLAAGSRNGLLGLGVVAIVFMIRSGMNARQTIFMSLMLLLGMWLFIKYGPESSQRVFELRQEDFVENDTGRAELWEELWPFIKSKWLLGWGVMGRELIGLSGNSHNLYITLIIFFGIPGGLAMGAFFIWSCLTGLFAQRGHENPFSSVSYLFSAYLITVFCTMAFEDTLFGIGSPWSVQIVLAIGVVNALSRPELTALLRGGPGMPMPMPVPQEPADGAWSPDDFR